MVYTHLYSKQVPEMKIVVTATLKAFFAGGNNGESTAVNGEFLFERNQ